MEVTNFYVPGHFSSFKMASIRNYPSISFPNIAKKCDEEWDRWYFKRNNELSKKKQSLSN